VERIPQAASWRIFAPAAALLAAAVFFFPLIVASRIPLFDPDEGLHAAIAQDMAERGDWIVPRFLGKPFLDKPILFFWAEAASLRSFGKSEAAVRFPGLMFGLLGAVSTAAIGWRLLGRTVGLLAGLFYATSLFPTAMAQIPLHDVALVPWINLALLFFWEMSSFAPRKARSFAERQATITILAGVMLGLAVLTKGLVGVALVGLTFGGYLLLTRRLRLRICLQGAAALAIAVGIGMAWYLAVERECPGYLRYFFVQRHLLGFTTDTQRHAFEPWWYYLPILVGGGMPWIAYVPTLIQDTWLRSRIPLDLSRSERNTEPNADARPLLLLVSWIVGSTLFLSVSHSKLITYIWPVFPAVAILAAVPWARLLDGRLTENARRTMTWTVHGTCLLGLPAVIALCLVIQQQFDSPLAPLEWTMVFVAATTALVPMWTWATRRPRATLAAALVAMAAQFVVAVAIVLPHASPGKTARDLAAHFNRLGQLPPQVLVADERTGSLVFYLDRKLREQVVPGQITYCNLECLPNRVPLGSGVLVLPDRVVREARQSIDLDSVPYEQVGRFRLYQGANLQEHLAALHNGRMLR
jgi:4-amino-4-deoxy-L-arabinose transferase-like glycosyltransferase